MDSSETQTVILYRQGEQDYITFGNGKPIEVKVVESVPVEISGAQPQPTMPGVTECCVHVPGGDTTLDAIHYASQIGRLDIVSLVLTLVALLVAIVGFGGLWLFRREAIAAAKETAAEIAGPEAERVGLEYVQRYMRDREAFETNSDLDLDEADDIAGAQDGE